MIESDLARPAASAAQSVADRITALGEPVNRTFELFVLTHIDADHINGVLPLFENQTLDARFEDIWFNGWRQVNPFLSIKQGEEFSRLLEDDPNYSLVWNRVFRTADGETPRPIVFSAEPAKLPSFDLADGMRLTLLSPGTSQLARLGKDWRSALEELRKKPAMLGRSRPPEVPDYSKFDVEALAKARTSKDLSVANGSSIAVLAEFEGRSILLTGDAHADVLAASIERLQRERGREGKKLSLDALKLSHHDSANATTTALLKLLDCRRYLVSSNGSIFYHPDREAIARIIIHGGASPTLFFNYRSEWNKLWDARILRDRYSYATRLRQPFLGHECFG